MHQDWPNPSSADDMRRGVGGREISSFKERDEPLTRADLKQRQEGFPEEGEVEYERSNIRIPFYLKGAVKGEEGRDVDVMNFDAFMRIVREPPTTNGIGYRQFEFQIDAWELNNTYSKGLNADITFALSDVPQPKSICMARQRESDYPALIVYSAIYDVYMGTEKIVDKQAGVAVATPVWEIPPRNVTVAFEKPFDSELFSFRPGCCEGMRSITPEEFEQGRETAIAIREGRYEGRT